MPTATASGKRQYIILGLMVLAVLYGIWELYPAGSHQKDRLSVTDARADLARFTSELLARRPAHPSVLEARLITAAETPWEWDPMVGPQTFLAWRAALQAPAPKDEPVHFDYTGFVDMGIRRLAVINDLDYVEGDVLITHDYRVLEIEPDKLILEHVVDGVLLEIPLQEIEMLGER